jgi:hypothetical protein
LRKAEAVVAAAEEKPELFGDLAERLKDDDVKVDAVHREMKQRQERTNYEAHAERGGDIGDLVQMAEAGISDQIPNMSRRKSNPDRTSSVSKL